METFHYKNIAKRGLVVLGVGVVKPGQEFESKRELFNVNLEPVKKAAHHVETKTKKGKA